MAGLKGAFRQRSSGQWADIVVVIILLKDSVGGMATCVPQVELLVDLAILLGLARGSGF